MVPGRHGRDSAVWWVDAFNRSVEVGGRRGLHVELTAGGMPVGRVRQVLLDPVRERWLIAAEDLPEGAALTLRVASSLAGPWATLSTRTLDSKAAEFTVATGSCFALGKDPKGVIAAGYRALLARRPVDLRVLTGDQIYMDRDPRDGTYFGLMAGAPYAEPNVSPMQRYEHQWRDPRWRDFLSATPTLCLSDDHEFWNDYPRRPPYLVYPKTADVAAFGAAFDVYQSALNVRPAGLPADPAQAAAAVRQGLWRSVRMDAPLVSVMLLDTRTRRQAPGATATFTSAANLDMLARWAKELTRPGVLFLGQPVSEAAPQEHYGVDLDQHVDSALRHYPAQYKALCAILADAARDVLVVSGDVHWSRLRALDLVRKGGGRRRVYELVSSNLTESLAGEPETSGALPEGVGAWTQCAGSDGRLLRMSEMFTLATLTFRAAGGGVEVETAHWTLTAPVTPRCVGKVLLQ
jgi:phosphodiesterase/alkaline phosphatase D-like protein